MRGHDDEVLDVVFDSTGQYVATASADKTGRVYDALNQLCIATLTGHQAEISKIAFNPQGNRLITASECFLLCFLTIETIKNVNGGIA